jgi:hypothetical protein
VQWALSQAAAADLRQVAIVYDWCFELSKPDERSRLAARLPRTPLPPGDIAVARDRAFAAIAMSDDTPDASRGALEALVRQWWRKQVAPALKSGDRVLATGETYALLELLHVMRDNLQIELRDDALPFFRDLPASRLLSYYPARYPAAENEYRIPFFAGKGDPDLRLAALARAADMAFVAYEPNAVESQFIQGWVSHDVFQLRGPFGAPYEFLWANPYQPGLSYHHMPLRFYDPRAGRLFVRSSWDDEATWAAYVGGRLQVFQDGKIQAAAAGSPENPAIVGPTAVAAGKPAMRWQLKPDHPTDWFLVGLRPGKAFDIEVDDEELAETVTDRGGIAALRFDRRESVGVRIRERS